MVEKVSTSLEDYLEALVMLGGQDGPIRSVDLAEKMGVSKPSVNKAVTMLKQKGYVTQAFYGAITLTDSGISYGQNVLRRHRALTRFLNKALGIDAETAEKEACMMEHAISDDSFEKWMAFIDSLGLD